MTPTRRQRHVLFQSSKRCYSNSVTTSWVQTLNNGVFAKCRRPSMVHNRWTFHVRTIEASTLGIEYGLRTPHKLLCLHSKLFSGDLFLGRAPLYERRLRGHYVCTPQRPALSLLEVFRATSKSLWVQRDVAVFHIRWSCFSRGHGQSITITPE